MSGVEFTENIRTFAADPWHIAAVLMAVNTAVFVLYGIDKSKAKSKKWRVPEKTLLWAAVLGPIGALAGMRVFRHKTKKPVFFITVPLIFLAEAAAAVYFIFIKN